MQYLNAVFVPFTSFFLYAQKESRFASSVQHSDGATWHEVHPPSQSSVALLLWKKRKYLAELTAWLAVALCSPSCSLSCLGSRTFRLSRFTISPSPVKMQWNNRIFDVWTMFRYQCGCYRVRLQFARPAGLSYKPVSYRRPQLSRQHHLDILKVQCIVQTAESNLLYERQLWHFTCGIRCHGRWFRRRECKSLTCLNSRLFSRNSISQRFWSVVNTRVVFCFYKAGCNSSGIVPGNEIISR